MTCIEYSQKKVQLNSKILNFPSSNLTPSIKLWKLKILYSQFITKITPACPSELRMDSFIIIYHLAIFEGFRRIDNLYSKSQVFGFHRLPMCNSKCIELCIWSHLYPFECTSRVCRDQSETKQTWPYFMDSTYFLSLKYELN